MSNSNNEWQKEYDSNLGKVTILTPPLKKVPGLRAPYQYELPAVEVKALVADLRKLVQPWRPNLQCILVESKGLAYGVRLSLFFLGHNTDWSGMSHLGVSEQDWDACINPILKRLRCALGEDVKMYVELWSATSKFQARFETYIKYKEL